MPRYLGFIGMSGAGKSYWGERFAQAGYRRLHCDDRIAARLRRRSGVPVFTLADMGRWMGLPHEDGYAEREQLYLHHEQAVLDELSRRWDREGLPTQSMVLDMSGSAIYAAESVLETLRRHLTIVYFAVSAHVLAEMVAVYIEQPRPVVWHGHYRPRPGEMPSATLARCYPQLLAARERRYETFCHVCLPYPIHRRTGLTTEELLAYIQDG